MRNLSNRGLPKKPRIIGAMMLLSLIGGYFLTRKIDLSAMARINSWLLGMLLVIAVLYMLMNTFSTWVLLEGMGYRSPFGQLYLVVTASLSTNYITPVKAGIPVRLWLYKSMLGIPLSSGSASLVIEIALGLLIGLILSLWGVQSVLQQYDIRVYLFLLSALVAGAAASLVLWPQLLNYCAKFLPSRYADRIIDSGRRFAESLKTVPRETLAAMVLLYLVRISARAICLYMILRDMNVSVSVLDLVFIQSIGGIVGIVSMLPMGIGAKDASLLVLMTQLGVPQGVALVAVLVDRALWTLVPLVAGIISANVLGVSKWRGQWNSHAKSEERASNGSG